METFSANSAFFCRQVRLASISRVEGVRPVRLDKGDFNGFLDQHPQLPLAARMVKTAIQRRRLLKWDDPRP